MLTYGMSERASGEAGGSTDTLDKSVVCPTCGKSDFKSRKYMKIHHNHKHGESISGEPVDCSQCGTTFRKQPHEIQEYENHFCSDKCHAKWRSGLTGKDSPRWNGGKPSWVCTNCEKKFQKYKSQLTTPERPFCSEDCHSDWYSGRKIESQRKRVTVSCDYCNSEVERRKCRVGRSDSVYCSRGCANQGHSERVSGDGNPRWVGGYQDYYGESWPKQRDKARKRDNYTCQRCEVDESDLGHELSVHHKIPFREFDDHKKANKLSNLISLCPVCHGKVEAWPVIPQ